MPNHIHTSRFGWLKSLLLAGFLLFSGALSAQFYHGSEQSFGKNRVQYDEFIWSFYKFDQYNVYFYNEGKTLAKYTAKTASRTLKEMQETFDYDLDERIYFMIYNKLEDFRQSNIGYNPNTNPNIGGVTRIQGSKVFLYFEGDHKKMEDQIRSGIAQIIIRKMMYGENWKEMIKNSTLLNLPEWYVNGLVSYATNPWSVEIDNRLRDGVLSERFEKFNHLTGLDAEYAGHSLWNYIAEVYGESVIPNILYMARISRNIESGFLFVLGVSLKTLTYESQHYYRVKYELEEEIREEVKIDPLKVKSRKNRSYSQLKVSPDGNFASFVTNQQGQYKVFIYDIQKKKLKRIAKGNHKLDRINDYDYPLLAWHPKGTYLTMINEKKGGVNLYLFPVEKGKKEVKPIFRLDRVLDYGYSDDGRWIVMSAMSKGQSDIFVYKVAASAQEQITNDVFDDLHPRFLNGKNEIIFSSNRSNDTLGINDDESDLITKYNDLFIYNYKEKDDVLRRVTNTPNVHEVQPMNYFDNTFVFLSDDNGIVNRYQATVDSAISFVDTTIHYRYFTKSYPISNYRRNILEQDISLESGKYAQIIFNDGKYGLYVDDLAKEPVRYDSEIQDTRFRENMEIEEFLKSDTVGAAEDPNENKVSYITVDVFNDPLPKDSNSIDINNYTFGNEEPKEEQPVNREEEGPTQNKRFVKLSKKSDALDTAFAATEIGEFVMPQNRNYNINFTSTDIVTQFDFDFANQIYQRFNGGPYFNPGMGSFVKLGVLDLFEDYKLEGGFRYSFNGNNTEYFISLANRERRLDKKYVLMRQAVTQVTQPDNVTLTKTYVHQGKAIFRWPFSEVAAIQPSFNLRNDRSVVLSVDQPSLQAPDEYITWGGGKLEYIFDNTIERGLNLYNGLRFKLFAEYMQEIGAPNSDIAIVGADFRHYQKIHRSLIWANRFAGSTSFGSRKLVYYMGSVDNWIVLSDRERFDFDTDIARDQNYYFQTIATNMRGFIQNARNGNSFAVLNSELRWPIFKYFLNKPIKSDLISNFQIIGFGDVGSAWTGSNPYSDDNSFNTTEIKKGPLLISLENQRDPIIGSYGFGFRSKIWGYFVRFDWAWGVEDGEVQDPITHLSLGLDF